MTQKKDENENGEGGGWIDANKGRKSKKNQAAKEQVQTTSERPRAMRSSSKLLATFPFCFLH